MTVTGLIVYAAAVSVLVAAAAWLLERTLIAARRPTRWAWLGALALCVALPIMGYRAPAEPGAAPADTSVGAAVEAPVIVIESVEAAPGPTASIAAIYRGARAGIERSVATSARWLTESAGPGRWIARLWGLASVLLATAVTGSMVRLGLRARAGSPDRVLGREVRITSDLGPATVGLLRPAIVLPRWARRLPEDDLELVLAHEEAHRRARDPLLLAIGLLPAIALPWNPLVWWQFRRLRDAVELDCDRRVLRSGVPTSPYGSLLVKLRNRARGGAALAPSMSSTPSLLERRLSAMRKTRPWHAVPRATLSGIAAITLLTVACTADPPTATHLTVERTGSVFVDGQEYAIEEISDALIQRGVRSEADLVVVADRAVPAEVMEQVFAELEEAGVPMGAPSRPEAPAAPASAPATPSPLANVLAGAVELRVETSGTVHVDGLPFELDDVSDELVRLDGEVEGPLVVAISSEQGVSNDVMSRLQDEIVAGGVQRVVFRMPGDPRPDQGFSIVLPTRTMEVPVSGRNLLHLLIQPDGMVDVSGGASTQVSRIRPAEVEGLWTQEVASNPLLIAAVKLHPDADFFHTVDVIRALRAANAQRISLQRLPVAPAVPPEPVSRAVAATPVPPAAPASPVQRITIEFRDTPIRVVLSAFSRLTGKTIEAAEAVTGTVSAAFEDQPWEDAFRAILRSLSLQATQGDDGTMRVERAP